MNAVAKLAIGIVVLLILVTIVVLFSSGTDKEGPSQSTPPPQPLTIPSRFMMNLYGTDLCADDGGSYVAGGSRFYGLKCNEKNLNHQFSYDPSTSFIKNINKQTLCFDDIAADVNKPGNETYLHTCGQTNVNQKWSMTPDAAGRGFKITNPNKVGLCLEGDPNGGKFRMNKCSDSVSQIFKLTSF